MFPWTERGPGGQLAGDQFGGLGPPVLGKESTGQVSSQADSGGGLTGEDGASGGRADWGSCIGIGEAHALFGQLVEVGGIDQGIALAC